MAGQALGLPSPWEHSIRAFEARDRRRAPGQGAIVFVGSSSFTLWSSLEGDMAPLPAVNRGFGGALIDDVVRYADRIVVPYQPAAVVLFAGTNDIAGARPASAGYVAERFDAFVAKVRLAVPEALIFYVAITPSRARWRLWPVAMEANRLIEARVRADAGLRFIDLGWFLLGRDGTPDPELYRRDGGWLLSGRERSLLRSIEMRIPSSIAPMACTRARAAIASGRERSPLRFITSLR